MDIKKKKRKQRDKVVDEIAITVLLFAFKKKKEGRMNLKLIISHLKIEARHTLSPLDEHLPQGKLKKGKIKNKND